MSAIHTERLVLRPPVEGDFADILLLWSSPEPLRHIGPPSTPAEAWARLLKYAGHWLLFGFGYRVIRERESGRFVGEAGVAYQRRAIPALGDDPEAGWALLPWAQGRGYASEALAVTLASADSDIAAARITCMITPANLPSISLAMRHGFEQFAETEQAGTPFQLFQRLRQ
jgi:RimJ/RimL family protein N-acetyltransferase